MLSKRTFILLIYSLHVFTSHAQPGERGLGVKKDTNVAKGNTYAIIVGISDYKLVPDLQYAHKDAQSFEDFLLSEAGGKVPKSNIETFLNANATRDNVGDAISVIARKVKPGDRVYFFFAGHGDMEDLTQIENGLLLLYNSPNGNYFGMNDDVLEILDLKRYLSPLSQRGVEMMFIVDACHSGNLTGGVEGVKQTGSALMSDWGKEFKILSCQPDQLSLESAEFGGGRGLFSLQLEEGMKGLADADGNGKISIFELQTYIQSNVAKYSEYKQIPMVSGDLSKSFFTVDPVILTALKKQKAENYPILASANTKGNEDKYIDSLDPAGKKIYLSFQKNLGDKRLIWPNDTNALRDYRVFEKKYKDNPLLPTMRRNLATGLNERFNSIVAPLLNDETSYSTRDACYSAAAELDSCLQLLGNQHYMYTNLEARKLFMDAMALTWALSESEYNISLKPDVERSIRMLEQSEILEPNAAYTLSALGVRYFFVYEYNKAFAKFQKYLDLRPNDFNAKYSMAMLYKKLKQYEKAAELFKKLIGEKPGFVLLHTNLFESYFAAGKKTEALSVARYITVSVDKLSGLFATGTYYSRTGNIDSAIHYYQLAKQLAGSGKNIDNNIGQIYFVNNKIDSARHYFNMALKADSTNPFPYFNLAAIDAINGRYKAAIDGFAKTVDFSPAFTEAFMTHFELYFGKNYNVADSNLYRDFRNKTFSFDLQWLGYKGILYCLLRDSALVNNKNAFDYVFPLLFNYKEQEVFSWYDFACFSALKQDKKTALESLERSLKLGFGNYFMLTSDDDLRFIRNTPEFVALLKKYFPAEMRK